MGGAIVAVIRYRHDPLLPYLLVSVQVYGRAHGIKGLVQDQARSFRGASCHYSYSPQFLEVACRKPEEVVNVRGGEDLKALKPGARSRVRPRMRLLYH